MDPDTVLRVWCLAAAALVRVDLDILGEDRLSRRLLRIADHSRDMRSSFDEALDVLADSVARQFDTEGAGTGGWAPLARSTVSDRGSAHPILVRTGALRDSLTAKHNANQVREVTASSATFGTRIPYAKYHHGKGPRSGTLPRRPLIAADEQTKRAVLKALQRGIFAR